MHTLHINGNAPYYLTIVGLFILLKFGFTLADNDHLAFLLWPVDKLVGLLTGSSSVYLADKGYYHDRLNILLDKSCSGFNFWMLAFLVFAYLAIKYVGQPRLKILSIFASLAGAYLLAVFVNASRIFASIIVQGHTKFLSASQQHLAHEAVGVGTNLSFLILAYYLIVKFLNRGRRNEKPT